MSGKKRESGKEVEQGHRFLSKIKGSVLEVTHADGRVDRIPLTDTQLVMILQCLGLRQTEEESVSVFNDKSLMDIMVSKRFKDIFGTL